MADSTTLNQNASHDTGLYDPDRHDNKIVAMYETNQRAHVAQDQLLAAGIPASAVSIVDRSDDRYAGGVDYESNTGLWGAVKSLFMPDEDAHGYAEGVNRGHAMLVVNPAGLDDRQRVIQLLESTDPIDFDAKLEEWRQAGYAYPGEKLSGTADTANASLATGTSSYAGVPHVASATETSTPIPMSAGPIVQHPTGVSPTTAAVATSTASATMPATPVNVSTSSAAVPAAATSVDDSETLKVMEERLRIGKREVANGAVRVRSYIVERPVQEQVHLHQEQVHLERHAVDRPASPADLNAFQERTIEVVARGEEAVVSKEARVVEEIAIRKDATDRVETVRDTVRRTEVEVDDTTTNNVSGAAGATDPVRRS